MKNKSQKATMAMTAILTASTVINPMAVSAYAKDTDTAVIGQQSEQDATKAQKEKDDTNLQKQEEPPVVVNPEENTYIKDTDKQTDTETPTEEEPAVQPETKKQETPNRLYRSIPTPKVVETIEINEANFPDKGFRDWILEQEYGKDEELTADEIANIKEIYMYNNKEITDLKGIEYFTALEDLFCYGTGIASLDISKNSNLKKLSCGGTEITSLDLSKNKVLNYLDCSDTDITSLDVSENLDLTSLNCGGTSITSVDVSENLELRLLNCSGLGITSLNVSKNLELSYLDCSMTSITSLDVSNNQVLEDLFCFNTGITSLDVSNNTTLKSLYCSNTEIANLDVSNNTVLKTLDCSKTEITSLDVSNNKALKELYCSNTKITSLDISNNTLFDLVCENCPLAWVNLGNNTSLYLSISQNLPISLEMIKNSFNIEEEFPGIDKSKISNVSGSDYDANTGIFSNYNKGTPIVYRYDYSTPNSGTKTIEVTINLIDLKIDEKNFPDETFRNWVLEQDYDKDGELTADEIANIKNINLSKNPQNNSIKSLKGIEYFTALEELICANTRIKKLDISKNTNLRQLNCSNTWVTKLDVSMNLALEGLYCTTTKITSLDVSNNMALLSLSIKDCPLAWVNIGNNPNLSLSKEDSTISIDASEDTFQITDKFVGIDKSKVDIKSGADYNSNTGIVSNYRKEEPIIFNYDCGTSSKGQETLQVTVKLTDIAINEKNFPDEAFRKWLTEQSYVTDGILKEEKMIQINEIDVSNNADIKSLQGIEYFTALQVLYCHSTGITTLDVSKNVNLKHLNCGNTKITDLDISNNLNLQYLSITDTKIRKLDVSNNQALNELYCNYSSLAWLKISENANYEALAISDSNVSLDMTEDTFNIVEEFPGIDISKISDVKGADYKNGIFSNYHKNTPIIYTYDYGTARTGTKPLQVTLNLIGYKEKSTISIAKLDKVYDEKPVNPEQAVKKTGSTGAVTYKWEEKTDDNNWSIIKFAPTNVGTYRVTATVAADDDYREATSEPKEFKISQAKNEWKSDLTIEGWTYKEKKNDPSASAKFGDPEFTYSDSEKGPFTIDVPTTAGTWYVKATVAETNNYKGLEAVKSFTIEKAESTISIKENLGKIYDRTAVNEKPNVDTSGSQGKVTYKWEKKMNDNTWGTIPAAPTNAGTYRVMATLLADKNYKEASSEPVEFTIALAQNEWQEELSIEDWTYLEEPKNPRAKAKHGTPVFTYSDSINGEFRKDVPTTAGTWYVKATVITENYEKLETTIEFTIEKADSTISITDSLDKTYDGKAVNANQVVETTGSNGTISYRWEKKSEDNTWEDMSSAPINVGNYRVIAKLAADNNYKEAYSTPVEFTITQATNEWKEQLSIKDWKYQDMANKPSAKAKFGTPVFMYSDSETGDFTGKVPTTVGTWYVKAVVVGNENYTGIEAVQSFTIEKADSIIHVIDSLDKTYDERAVDEKPKVTIKGSSGRVSYKWEKRMGNNWVVMDSAPMNAGTYRVTAVLAGDDNFNETSSEPKVFRIAQAPNAWVEDLSIMNWTYQGAMKQPSASVKYGTPVFTYSDSKDGIFTSKVPTTAGTWYVKATVITENYAKLEVVQSFTIEPKHIEEDSEIRVPEITPETKLDDLSFQDGDKVLVQGTDYVVTKKQNGNKVTVTITFKGNYRGEITKTYIVNEDKGSANTDHSVDTGDTTRAGLWATFLALSGGFIVFLTGKKRKSPIEKK